MTLRLQNLMLAMLLALTTLFVGFGTLSQNPTSGGYQLLERAASGISADIQLASLGNFASLAETASEYVNTTNRVPDVPEGVPYFRVEGGGSGNATSRNALAVNADGTVSIAPGCTGSICVSVGDSDHAAYYLTNKRPDGSVVVFDVDRATHNQIMDNLVPQQGNSGAGVKLTDASTPGTSIELDRAFSEVMTSGSSNGRVLSQQEFLMNLAEIDTELRGSLLSEEKTIGLVVHQGKIVWLIDWSDHFTMDQQKNIDAMCREDRYRRFMPKGLTPEQWNEKLQRDFRGGIPTLTADLFSSYRDGPLAKVVATDMLRDEFFIEDNGQYADLSGAVETELSFNTPMSEDFVQLRMRLFSKLPKFYINYDRKIFMHMMHGRSYDAVVLDGWWGTEGDFEHLVPTSHRYWARDISQDFWAITNFRNG